MIELRRLRERLGLQPEDEDRLEETRDEVVAAFESGTGRPWLRREDHVEDFRQPIDGNLTAHLLSLRPVESIASVETRSRGAEEFTALDADEYEVDGEGMLRLVDGSAWPWWTRVTYTGGYATTADTTADPPIVGAPADVLRALEAQALFLARRLAPETIAESSKSFGESSTSYLAPDEHPLFASALRRYRRWA